MTALCKRVWLYSGINVHFLTWLLWTVWQRYLIGLHVTFNLSRSWWHFHQNNFRFQRPLGLVGRGTLLDSIIELQPERLQLWPVVELYKTFLLQGHLQRNGGFHFTHWIFLCVLSNPLEILTEYISCQLAFTAGQKGLLEQQWSQLQTRSTLSFYAAPSNQLGGKQTAPLSSPHAHFFFRFNRSEDQLQEL